MPRVDFSLARLQPFRGRLRRRGVVHWANGANRLVLRERHAMNWITLPEPRILQTLSVALPRIERVRR